MEADFMVRWGRLLSKIYGAIFILFLQCNVNEKYRPVLQSFNIDQVNIHTSGGISSIKNIPYSGRLYALFPNSNDTMEIRSYLNGKEDGEWKQFYENHKLKEVRYFKAGKKDGRYLGWWDNGKKKLDFFFVADEYEGTCREWSSTGRLLREMNYHAGHEAGSQKAWYDNGKVKANYCITNGRRYGLLGTKNCVNVSDSIFKK